jgi:hypothetical protein
MSRLGKVKKTTEKTEWKAIETKADVEQDLDSDMLVQGKDVSHAEMTDSTLKRDRL